MLDPRQASFVIPLALLVFVALLRRAPLARADVDAVAFPRNIELVVDDGRGERSITAGRIALIGRAPNVDVRLSDPQVSRLHARLEVREDGTYVEDLGSRNGTVLNGVPLARPEKIEPGDQIIVGNARIIFRGIGQWR